MKKHYYPLIISLLFFTTLETINAQEDSLDELHKKIKNIAAKGNFSGVAFYAKNKNTSFSEAYGYANSKQKIKNHISFKYNLGSINKLFTKIAITKLVMEEKLSLNDKVKKYIPSLYKNGTDKVTILHLLTMTSGFGDYLTDQQYTSNRKSYINLSDYLSIIINKDLLFEPGSQRQYSNVGFELLGLVIESVTKMSYYSYVQKYIFDVANMPNTGYFTQDDNLIDLAIGYHKLENERLIPNWNLKSYKGTAAGGGYSTVVDMYNLAKSLMNYEILDKLHLDLLCRKFRKSSSKGFYLAVAGGAPGINARFYFNRITHEVIIIFANQDPPAANKINDLFKNLSK